MLEVVSWYVIALITHFLDCYFFSKFADEKLRITKKTVLIILLFSIVDCFLGVGNVFVKMAITNLITFILLKINYNKSNSKTLLITFLICLGYAFAELLYAVFLYLLIYKIWGIEFGGYCELILSNFLILLFYALISTRKRLQKLINNIVKWSDQKSKLNVLSNCILSIIVYSVLMYPLYINNIAQKYALILFAFIVAVLVFVVGYFKEKSDNNRLTIRFTQLLAYVKDYEKEVVAKGKTQHEYKNQLGVIAGMIPENDKKLNDLRNYVNKELTKANKLDDNTWLEKITNLPFGGIKGLVYLKIKESLGKNIILHIEVDKKLSVKKKWTSINNNLEDYTRILGVYLDNAIEAAYESNEKQIIIQFIDNKDNVEFVLSNTYNETLNIDNIGKEKFSTKGKGRGYGLSLVKDIIENNELISEKREIDGKFYVQKLYIKK